MVDLWGACQLLIYFLPMPTWVPPILGFRDRCINPLEAKTIQRVSRDE